MILIELFYNTINKTTVSDCDTNSEGKEEVKLKLTNGLKKSAFWNRNIPKTPFPKSAFGSKDHKPNVVKAASISNGGGSGLACSPGDS